MGGRPTHTDARIELVRQHVLAEVDFDTIPHKSPPLASPGLGIQQIAVRHEVAVRVGPGACHARGAEGGVVCGMRSVGFVFA